MQTSKTARDGNSQSGMETSQAIKGLGSVAKGGSILAIGFMLSKAFIFLRQIVITHLLSPSDYGLFSLGFILVTFYIMIASLGLQSGAQRLIAFNDESQDIKTIRGTIFSSVYLVIISSIVTTLIALILAWPLPGLFNEPELRKVLLLLIPVIPLGIGISLIAAFFLGFKKVGPRAYLEDIGLAAGSFFMILVFTLFSRSLTSALIGVVIAYLITFIVSLSYSIMRFPITVIGKERRKSMARELLAFSMPLLMVLSLNFFVAQTDTLILGLYEPAAILGFYNAAFSLSVFIGVLFHPFSSIYLSIAANLISTNATEVLNAVYESFTKWIFFFTLPVFFIFFIFPGEILGATYGEPYRIAASTLRLLCLGEFVLIITGPNAMTIIAFGDTKRLMAYYLSGALINVMLNLLLIPDYGINGAAIASTVSLIMVNILCSLHLFFLYKVHPFRKSYNRVILTMMLVCIVLGGIFYTLLHIVAYFPLIIILCLYPLIIVISYLLIKRDIGPVDRFIIDAVKKRVSDAVMNSLLRPKQK